MAVKNGIQLYFHESKSIQYQSNMYTINQTMYTLKYKYKNNVNIKLNNI